MVKVSVIIPVYNVEDYLKECLDSVLSQTLKDIEVICVDDCSTDDSLKILQEYANKDDRIKIIKNEKNSGQGFSRNEGIKKATGEYIGFVDSDDWIELNTFESTYMHAKKNNLDMVIFKVINYNSNLKEFYETNYYNMDFLENEKEIFNYNDLFNKLFLIPVGPVNKIYKTSILKENDIFFPEQYSMFEDNPFFHDAFLSSNKVSLIPNYFYYRRVHENSVMQNRNKSIFDIVPVLDDVISVFIKHNLFEEFNHILFNHKLSVIKMWYEKLADEYKPDFYMIIKENFEKNKCINDIPVENKLTDENFDFYSSFFESDTFKEFNLIMFLKLMKLNYNVYDYLFEDNLKKSINYSSNRLNANNKYEDKIRYLNHSIKLLKKELSELKSNNSILFKK